MTIYSGILHSGGCGPQLVAKDDDILVLKVSQDIYNHSPDGFSWGYGGSGPAQLALALLYDVTHDRETSLRHHQDFKWEYVARWGDEWQITSEEILVWLGERRARNEENYNVNPVLRSAQRLAEAEEKLKETNDPAWLWFLRHESSILLRRTIKVWLKLRFRRVK